MTTPQSFTVIRLAENAEKFTCNLQHSSIDVCVIQWELLAWCILGWGNLPHQRSLWSVSSSFDWKGTFYVEELSHANPMLLEIPEKRMIRGYTIYICTHQRVYNQYQYSSEYKSIMVLIRGYKIYICTYQRVHNQYQYSSEYKSIMVLIRGYTIYISTHQRVHHLYQYSSEGTQSISALIRGYTIYNSTHQRVFYSDICFYGLNKHLKHALTLMFLNVSSLILMARLSMCCDSPPTPTCPDSLVVTPGSER